MSWTDVPVASGSWDELDVPESFSGTLIRMTGGTADIVMTGSSDIFIIMTGSPIPQWGTVDYPGATWIDVTYPA